MQLSLVIPVFNEHNRIGSSLDTIQQYLEEKGWLESIEIIVSDDGSQDDTLEVVKRYHGVFPHLKILPNAHLGKGSAVREGMKQAQGEYQIFMDADLSTPVREIERFLDIAQHENIDVVIGSRAHAQSQITARQPWYREFLGKLFNRILRSLSISHISDTQCGFKLFSQKASEAVFFQAKLNGATFDVELLLIAETAGFSIREEPVEWNNSAESRFKMTPRFAWQVLRELGYLRHLKKNIQRQEVAKHEDNSR